MGIRIAYKAVFRGKWDLMASDDSFPMVLRLLDKFLILLVKTRSKGINLSYGQACRLKFRLRELTSCLCSAAALAFCFEGCMADLDPTVTGNGLSQLKFVFTCLAME